MLGKNLFSSLFSTGLALNSGASLGDSLQVGLGNAFDFSGVKNAMSDFGGYVENALTGNRDYQRSLDTLAAENAFTAQQNEIARNFNAAEAEKARTFQKDLQDNQILSTANQLRQLGINPYAVLSGNNAVAPSAVSAYSSSQGSSHAPTYQSGQQVTQMLAGLVNSAFGLAKLSMLKGSGITNYIDRNGMVYKSVIKG